MEAGPEREFEDGTGEEREPSKAREVFRAGSGERKGEAQPVAPATKAMSSEGWFGTPFTLAVGLTALGAAGALAAVHAQQRARAGAVDVSITGSVVQVLLWGVVGSLLGFAALKGVAMWRKRAIGDARLALVRMFAATGLFMLVLNMGIAPTGWWMVDRPIGLGTATAVYLAVVWASFRLSREDAMAVLFAHALAWVGVYGAARVAPRLWREPAAERAAPVEGRTFEPPHAPAGPEPAKPEPTPPPPETSPSIAPPGSGGGSAR